MSTNAPRQRAPRQSRIVPGSDVFKAAPTPQSRRTSGIVNADAGPSARKFTFKSPKLASSTTTASAKPSDFLQFPSPPLFQFALLQPDLPDASSSNDSEENPLFDSVAPNETLEAAEARYDAEFEAYTQNLPVSPTQATSHPLSPSFESADEAVGDSEPHNDWIEMSNSSYIPTSGRAPPIPYRMKITTALADIRRGRVSPSELLCEVLDPQNTEHDAYRREFYKEDNPLMENLLDLMMQDPKGKAKLMAWMQPHALELMCDTVYNEMDIVKKEMFFPGVRDIPPKFFDTWTLENTVIPTAKKAPCLSAILMSAAQTRIAKAKNKLKDPAVVRFSLLNLVFIALNLRLF